MIDRITVCRRFGGTIVENLALEEALLTFVEENELILYLWSNPACVVIGRNQNAYQECYLDAMERDGVVLARRKSGGGAVYQDDGNMNISFLCRESGYQEELQYQVLIHALAKLGIPVSKSGRNDLILENGRKVSGMAFFQTQDKCLQHGTMLIHTDLSCMEKYLNVSEAKLKSKGIRSVGSRVANLPGNLTRHQVETMVISSVCELYKCKKNDISDHIRNEIVCKMNELKTYYADEKWRYAKVL